MKPSISRMSGFVSGSGPGRVRFVSGFVSGLVSGFTSGSRLGFVCSCPVRVRIRVRFVSG